MKKRNLKRWTIISMIVLAVLSMCVALENRTLAITEYRVSTAKLPESFDGFRIAQISDLHNTKFGEENSGLLQQLSEVGPDLIVLTGDLIDSRRTDIDIALVFARNAAEIAPVYYVTGNHEARVPEYEKLKTGLTKASVTVLDNQKTQISRNGESISIIGINDPSFRTDYLFGDAETVAEQAITSLQKESDGFTVLLSHRPELFNLYVETGVDLVFSGHAHGGQFRLPFVGGLFAPNQGFFPEYDAGKFFEKNTTMIVSRGVGNSIIPFRINNSPEIVVTELSHADL